MHLQGGNTLLGVMERRGLHIVIIENDQQCCAPPRVGYVGVLRGAWGRLGCKGGAWRYVGMRGGAW